jgi:hypothetical protein
MNEIAFIAPTIFTVLVGLVVWDIKTKLSAIFTKMALIETDLHSLAVSSEKNNGELKLEISKVETKFLSVFATKPDLNRLEEKIEHIIG